MKIILAAAALMLLGAPAFAVPDDHQAVRDGDSHYGLGASRAENERANAASTKNVALTRGPDDPRYEGSAATPPTWKQARGD